MRGSLLRRRTVLYAQNPLLDSLVSYWKLEESGASSRVDSHGTNHLSVVGTVGQAAGKVGNAADFNTGANRLSVADNASVSMGSGVNFSIVGNCYLDDLTKSIIILGKNAGLTGAATEYILQWQQSATRFNFYVADGTTLTTVNASANTGIVTGTWYHLAVTMNGTTGAIVTYLNGAQYTTGTGTYARDGTNAATIGDRSATGYNPDGRIDEVGLWRGTSSNAILTAAQIAYIYNGGNIRTYPFLT